MHRLSRFCPHMMPRCCLMPTQSYSLRIGNTLARPCRTPTHPSPGDLKRLKAGRKAKRNGVRGVRLRRIDYMCGWAENTVLRAGSRAKEHGVSDVARIDLLRAPVTTFFLLFRACRLRACELVALPLACSLGLFKKREGETGIHSCRKKFD